MYYSNFYLFCMGAPLPFQIEGIDLIIIKRIYLLHFTPDTAKCTIDTISLMIQCGYGMIMS